MIDPRLRVELSTNQQGHTSTLQKSDMWTIRHRAGFTLIELAIVLVIIGLIIGGILVGRDLIQVARNRQVISDAEKYQTAVNAFRDRYQALPGDMPNAYDLFSDSCEPGTPASENNGDGDGYIDKGSDTGWEIQLFWCQLALSGFIAGSYIHTDAGPKSSYSDNAYFNATDSNFQCYFSDHSSCIELSQKADSNGSYGAIVPIDAQSIDQKMDDGKPDTGNVLEDFTSTNPPSAAENCGDWGQHPVQNIHLSSTTPSCRMMFKIY